VKDLTKKGKHIKTRGKRERRADANRGRINYNCVQLMSKPHSEKKGWPQGLVRGGERFIKTSAQMGGD